MLALSRTRVVAEHKDKAAEAVFIAEVTDGKRYEVRVTVDHGGERGARYAQGLLMAIWTRIEDYGWEGGTTVPTPGYTLTITEVAR